MSPNATIVAIEEHSGGCEGFVGALGEPAPSDERLAHILDENRKLAEQLGSYVHGRTGAIEAGKREPSPIEVTPGTALLHPSRNSAGRKEELMHTLESIVCELSSMEDVAVDEIVDVIVSPRAHTPRLNSSVVPLEDDGYDGVTAKKTSHILPPPASGTAGAMNVEKWEESAPATLQLQPLPSASHSPSSPPPPSYWDPLSHGLYIL